MTENLEPRYPEAAHLLGAYLHGDDPTSGVEAYVAVEGPERAARAEAEIHEVTTDDALADDDVDAFVASLATWSAGSGRATLRAVSDLLGVLAPTPRPDAPPADVRDRLAAWLEAQGFARPDDRDLGGWEWTDVGDGAWMAVPPGLAGVLFAITPSAIRAIQPAFESVPDALAELGIEA